MKTDQTAAAGNRAVGNYGLVICPSCNEIIDTLPTNGVKRMYSLCESLNCREPQVSKTNAGEE
ncbi:GapA-binding peptide SR1P [Paenibacillus pasadenensis]|uniref:GapA-binding peptide SR1P n=1 Tax=Paenibacillus pasadenensis TaxID=217090 RepID=UPI00204267A8|nr:GapA-binding peptide SR1P [Paenibacillus pasadenensis]MCM3748481.1 GapA-binding peptide SR1P [Paenibacillus pasadenensis]